MLGTDYFQIIHGEPMHVGELAPTGTFTSLEKGTSMSRSGDELCVVTDNVSATGFTSKKITDAGPSYEDMNFNIDLPAKKGQKVTLLSLPDGSQIEVEGEPGKISSADTLGLLVTSGTGAILANSAVESDLSFLNGRWRLAQTGNRIEGVLKQQLSPIVDPSNIRILIEIRRAGLKA